MKTNISRSSIGIFQFATVIMTIKLLIDYTQFISSTIIDSLLILLSLGIYLYVIIFQNRYTLKQLIIVGIIGIMCVYSAFVANDYNLVMTFIFIIAAKNKDIHRTIKNIHFTKLIFVFSSMILYVIIYFLSYDILNIIYKNGRIIHSFGFTHPNVFALVVFWMICEWIYLYYKKIRLYHIPILLILAGIIYFLTECDTYVFVSVILCILIFIDKTLKKRSILLKNVATYLFPILSVFTIVGIASIYYQNTILYPFYKKFDLFITQRFTIGAKALDLYGWSLIGQKSPKVGNVWDARYGISRITYDGLYVFFAVSGGLLFLILLSYLLYIWMKRGDSTIRDWIFSILYSVYALIEMQGVNAVIVFPLFIAGAKFWVNKKVEESR